MAGPGDGDPTGRRQLEARLAGLEEKMRTLEREPCSSDERLDAVDAELRVMREALDDLAADVLDMHGQMATLVSACERILAGAAGGGIDITLDRGAGVRGPTFVVRRAARRAVRATLGAARRVLGAPQGEEPPARSAVEIRTASAPATSAPSVSVIIPVDDDPESHRVPEVLEQQTDGDVPIVIWNPESGIAATHLGASSPKVGRAPDRRSLVEALGSDYVAEVGIPMRPLLPTLLEICRWTLASEDLPLLVGRDPGRPGPKTVLTVSRAERWSEDDGSAARRRFSKLVGSACRTSVSPVGGPVAWGGGSGGYLLETPGRTTHEVAPLDGVVAPSVAGDDRPHVLILTPLSTGAEELAMWLIRGLADSMSISVVLVEGCGERKRLVRAMAGLTPMVYPVADFLHPSVWASAARDLVSARGVTSVLRIGGAGRIAVEIEDGPPVFDLPLDPSEVGSDPGTVLAIGESIAEAARRAGSEVVPLAGAPSLPSIPPDPEAAATVRSGLGISIDQRLVVGIADLEAEQRPEDVVAVAQRLRHREDIHFLLVGDGELAGTVSDIARHYGLENFTLAPRTHGVFELVLAADVVVIAAERDPWSTPAVAALALGRHLVATDVPARRELVDGWDEDRVALVRPGDVSGLAGAVETAIDRRRKPRATKKAWKAAAAGSVRGLGRVAELFLAVGAGAKGEG